VATLLRPLLIFVSSSAGRRRREPFFDDAKCFGNEYSQAVLPSPGLRLAGAVAPSAVGLARHLRRLSRSPAGARGTLRRRRRGRPRRHLPRPRGGAAPPSGRARRRATRVFDVGAAAGRGVTARAAGRRGAAGRLHRRRRRSSPPAQARSCRATRAALHRTRPRQRRIRRRRNPRHSGAPLPFSFAETVPQRWLLPLSHPSALLGRLRAIQVAKDSKREECRLRGGVSVAPPATSSRGHYLSSPPVFRHHSSLSLLVTPRALGPHHPLRCAP